MSNQSNLVTQINLVWSSQLITTKFIHSFLSFFLFFVFCFWPIGCGQQNNTGRKQQEEREGINPHACQSLHMLPQKYPCILSFSIRLDMKPVHTEDWFSERQPSKFIDNFKVININICLSTKSTTSHNCKKGNHLMYLSCNVFKKLSYKGHL